MHRVKVLQNVKKGLYYIKEIVYNVMEGVFFL